MLEQTLKTSKHNTIQPIHSRLNDYSMQGIIPSTIIPIPQMDIHEASKKHQYHHLSPYDQLKEIPILNNGSSKGILSFQNIQYTLNNSMIENLRRQLCISFFKPKPSKRILDGVSGIFKPGMNALMGPTGCGKSSLLDVLANRKDRGGLLGDIFFDGLPLSRSLWKYTIGYVVQDDVLSGTLTVRENIMFSANVRFPPDITLIERERRVQEVIEQLGIESCADTRVGTEFTRGVSGGERKRTCIAMELVLKPKVLFLDEPTTGLDSSTARNVMEYLSKLGKEGHTIVFSIHQPRYSIFKLFDRVVLMCKGFIVYQGSTDNISSYFMKQGYKREKHDNAADFVLDVLIDANEKKNEHKLYRLLQIYLRSSMCAKVHFEIENQKRAMYYNMVEFEKKKVASRPFFRELYYIAKRALTNIIRDPSLLMSQVVVALILGLLIGLVFFEMDPTVDPGIQNRLGAIFLIVSSQILVTVTGIESLIKERALFIHENISGYYRIITYFVTKLLCDILPLRTAPSIVFSLLAYFMTGLQRSSSQFFIFLLTVFMCNIFGSALCFFFSALIPVFAVALVVVIMVFVIMMIFSGFIVDLSSLYEWLAWLKWISAFRYASNMLTVNEFKNITFCLANMTSICPQSGIDVLVKKDIHYETRWDKWKNIFILSMMAIGFFILAFVQLVRMKKTK